ncbi:MAG: class I SAM-dependent methyltransferase [Cytophagales bacterium]|nr:class I SAM-dependent methyltransferase [Cytophagales bacterium]MDW8384060.1 class I SAM-dependent methyltransferase [Flammeovirgaceae bacterium]
MIQRLIEYGKNQSFQPDFFSIWLNPFYFIRKELFVSIKNYAPMLSGKLLDFGCGRKPYRHLFSVDEYIGIDIETSGHSHENSQVDIFYDGKHIPFPNATFDCVFCSEVIEHVFEPDAVLKEIHRVLKPNALGLFTVPFAWSEHEQPYDYGRYTSFGIKYLFEKNGFEVIKHQKTGNFIKVIFQLSMLYGHLLFPKNKIISTLLNVVCISPIAILGIFLSWLLPANQDLYFNNIVLVRKK